MYKGNKIYEEQNKQLRPIALELGRAYGLPKRHKAYANLSSFQPITDTTSTPYYNIGIFLSYLLQPFIGLLQPLIGLDKYNRSYFMKITIIIYNNVTVKTTINIILDRVYNRKLIKTNLKKKTMKKLHLDSCIKTNFSFDNVLYEQCDIVSMGSSLGPVLANVILTEKPLIEAGVLNFYCIYLDDTLVVIKRDKIQHSKS